jgi:NADH-quinone oxidoreductase subunit F
VLHRGAGAYICGEETGLLESLEGKRGQPRSKPPFPAISGLSASPTLINNVETIATVPQIVARGGAWYAQLGVENSTGTRVFSLSGNVVNGGNFELPLGTTLAELVYEIGGGIPDGRRLKAIIPGGSSVPIQTVDEAEATLMDYEGFVAKGSMLGSGGVIIIDDAQDLVKQIARLARFYAHESCAQCTQCREGTAWTTKILERMVAGDGTAEDLDTLLSIADAMTGKTICVLSDSCATPVVSGINKFREDFEALIKRRTVHAVPAAVA